MTPVVVFDGVIPVVVAVLFVPVVDGVVLVPWAGVAVVPAAPVA